MRGVITVLLILIAFCRTGNAQSPYPENVPDTLKPQKAIVQFYVTLDSLAGDTLYVLESPKGYVIRPYGYSSVIKIAVQTKKGFHVFDGDPDGVGGAYTFSRIDFNGEGHEELQISWSDQNGRSGFIDGWIETTAGWLLWDLDNRELIFQIQDQYEYSYWSTGAEFDSLGDLLQDSLGNVIMNDSLATEESGCENYSVDIGYRKITVKRSIYCTGMYETGEEAAEDTGPKIYIWTKPKRKK